MYIKKIFSSLNWRHIHRKKAFKCKTIEELQIAAKQLDYSYFTHYVEKRGTKEREFKSAVQHLNIQLDGKTVFDIGPGTGDSLQVAKKMGATRTIFVDSDPFFYQYNTLHGHVGVFHNYLAYPFFDKCERGKVDFVWAKGSIDCSAVNLLQRPQFSLRWVRWKIFLRFDFVKWIKELKSLLVPGGKILLLPAMGYQKETIIDPEYDLVTNYWCPDVPAFEKSYFSQSLFDAGFTPVRDIPYYNQAQSFPLAFYFVNEPH